MTQQHKNLQSNPYPHLRIDREQAIAMLEILGYQQGVDTIYPRAIVPDGDARKNTFAQARNLKGLKWAEIERFNQDGYGIYFVINDGGHADKDVTSCRAIFCEFDDRPIEDQISFWLALGLPEPSLQVATRKSVHTYWVLSEPICVEQWRELQANLLLYTGSDQSLKNPSRVMRLAGAYHIKPGCDPLRCDIIHQLGKKYSAEELRTAIPVGLKPPVDPQRSLLASNQTGVQPLNTAPKYQRFEDIQVPVPESVPLSVCLSKESRALLASGVSEGGRNNGGAKLARDLIGTASYLQSIAQHFDGDPRQLLEDYASRCTPPLPPLEVDAIWKSAEKDCPTPSCKPEGVEACVTGWYWNYHIKPNQAVQGNSFSKKPGRGFGGGSGGNGGDTPSLTAVPLCLRIREILNRYEQESLQVNALMDLAAATGRTYNEINQLARIIRAEGEMADEVIEAVKSFGSQIKSCRKRLDIRRYLEPALAQPLLAKASAMPTAPEYLFNTLLAVVASVIGTTARVIINPEGGYFQPCIFWTANVSHSGQAKTPPQQQIVHPLEEMEAAAKDLYDAKLEDYDLDSEKDAKPPVRQRHILNNATTSTKIRIHGENPRGLLEYIDEIVADYQRLNQYKGGKGDDLQLELSFWNGSGGNFDRSDARLFLKSTALSKTGTYQWDTLARLMGDEVNFISSGYSARFLYCSIMNAPPRYLDLLSSPGEDTLTDKLHWLYSELEKLPKADYLLDHEAKVLFQAWNHALVNAEIEEAHYGLSLVYPKIESYTARLALWLHIVNALLRGEKPAPVISGETMQRAIEIASFYLWQHKLIHAHNSPTRKLEGIFLKVQTLAEKFFSKSGKGVGASFLKSRINALKGWVVEKIRSSLFKALVSAGHGRIEGEGSDMVYIPNTVPGDVPPDGVGGFGKPNGPGGPGGSNGTDEIGEVGGIGGELVVPPIAKNTAHTEVQTTIGEIGGNIPPDLFSRQPSNELELDCASQKNHRTVASTGGTPARHSQDQFTNSSAETIVDSEFQAIGDHQSTHTSAHQSPTYDPPGGDGGSPVTPTYTPPNGDDGGELLNDEEMAVWHSRLNACQTLEDAMNFHAALDALSPSQRHQFESSVPQDRWTWLWSLPEKEPESESMPESMPSPTLEELKALLLACDSLVKLNQLKRKHRKTIALAENSMSEKEQATVDALAALAVPYKVFKYLGEEIKLGTQRLIRGMLVYIDPQIQVRARAYSAPVWALNGMSSSWVRPIHVSVSLLKEVVKVILPNQNDDGGQQMGLI